VVTASIMNNGDLLFMILLGLDLINHHQKTQLIYLLRTYKVGCGSLEL